MISNCGTENHNTENVARQVQGIGVQQQRSHTTKQLARQNMAGICAEALKEYESDIAWSNGPVNSMKQARSHEKIYFP